MERPSGRESRRGTSLSGILIALMGLSPLEENMNPLSFGFQPKRRIYFAIQIRVERDTIGFAFTLPMMALILQTTIKYFVRLMILSKPFDRSLAQNGLKHWCSQMVKFMKAKW